MQTSRTESRPDRERDCGCQMDIHIHSQGDVNIYNCPPGAGNEAPPQPGECPPPPTAPGACVPLAPGGKHKQSPQRKFQHRLSASKVPSSLAASTYHLMRRFLAGKAPANALENLAFQRMRDLPPDFKRVLSCALDSFDQMPPAERDRLVVSGLGGDVNTPIDADTLAQAVVQELTQRAGELIFGDPIAAEQERPGRNRFFDPGAESFDAQLRICKVNGLRTNVFKPTLGPGDYLPGELEQVCTEVLVNNQVEIQCQQKVGDCTGFSTVGDICLAVPEVENGAGVILEGVNFMSLDAIVRLTAHEPGTATADVETQVFGDLDTPLTEVVDGQTRFISDCRVHDRMTFVVPDDLPPGLYNLQILFPNTVGIPNLGDPIGSAFQIIRVIPPSTARFQITLERMNCRKETSPASLGSDEVGLSIVAAALLPDGNTDVQPLKNSDGKDFLRFDDVDSGNQFPIERLVFNQQQPILAVAMLVLGYEVDSERAFEEQITSGTDFFVDLVKEQWNFIKDNELVKAALKGLVSKFGIYGIIAIAIAAVVLIAVDAIIAGWAPADPIMQESFGFSLSELVELTSVNFPTPGFGHFDATDDISVDTTPLEKLPNQYREFREYASDDEDSRYDLFFRYNRTA